MSDSSDIAGRQQVLTKENGSQKSEGATFQIITGTNNGGITLSYTANTIYLNRVKALIPGASGSTADASEIILFNGPVATGDTLTPENASVLQVINQPADGFKLAGAKLTRNGRLGYSVRKAGGGTLIMFLHFEYDAE